jgi:hypothetical protein
MRKFVIAGIAAAAATSAASAAVNVTVDPGANWLGFMNVYNLPSAGGAFQFPSPWGTADLTATFSGDVLTLGPNSIGDTNEYWYQGVGTNPGGPGAPGNKIMEANMYVEDNSLAGQVVSFTYEVLSNTFTSAHNSVAFIKDFAPDYSTNVTVTLPLTPGVHTITLDTIDDPARHVQFGFQTTGVNVWITDVAPFGNAQVRSAVIPEPTMLGLLALAPLALRRR